VVIIRYQDVVTCGNVLGLRPAEGAGVGGALRGFVEEVEVGHREGVEVGGGLKYGLGPMLDGSEGVLGR
jgi:hypothetical protein